MPSDVELKSSIKTALENSPGGIGWGVRRLVNIQAVVNRKLGLTIRTFQETASNETYTVITRVKADCCFLDSERVLLYDRVIAINEYSILKFVEQQVLDLLDRLKGRSSDPIQLTVCKIERVKNILIDRSFSNTSGSSQESFNDYRCQQNMASGTDKPVTKLRLSGGKIERLKNIPIDRSFSNTSGSSQESFNDYRCQQNMASGTDKPVTKLRLSGGSDGSAQDHSTGCHCDRKQHVGDPEKRLNYRQKVHHVDDENRVQSLKLNTAMLNVNLQQTQSLPVSFSPKLKTKSKKIGHGKYISQTFPVIMPDENQFLLKNPHMVRWSQTKTICLKKSPKGNFGFRYHTTRVFKNADGSSEDFTLVKSVQPEGPCFGKLVVGDWIRSVNGVPLQNKYQVDEMGKSIKGCSTIKMVIQRPEGLSSNPLSPSQSLESVHVSLEPPPPSTCHISDVAGPCQSVTMLTIPLPGSPMLDPDSENTQIKKLYDRSPDSLRNDPLSDAANSPRDNTKKELRGPLGAANSKFPLFYDTASQKTYLLPESGNNEAISMKELNFSFADSEHMQQCDQEFIKTVKLPKVRIFICGQEAVNFSKIILKNQTSFIDADQYGFSCIRCSIQIDDNGIPQFDQWSTQLYTTVLNNLQFKELSESQASKKLANEKVVAATDQSHHQSKVVNAEIFIIPDDRFLHHCSYFLFTQTSIFFLTFSGAKVLKSAPTEIIRLQNQIHTIRSCAGDEAPVLCYGLVNESTQKANTLAEVQTLFYTSYGDQLKKYDVNSPELLDCSCSSDYSAGWIRKVEKELWTAIMDVVQYQQILVASLSAIIHLERQLGSDHWVISEDMFTKIVRSTIPNCQQDLQHMILLELRSYGQILSTKSGPMTSTNSVNSLLILDPKVLLKPINHLIHLDFDTMENQEQVKQKWLDLQCTALLSCCDFTSYSMNNDKESHIIMSFLESFGILHRNGNNYCIPYFLQEPNYLEEPRFEKGDTIIHIKFRVHVFSLVFFQLIWYIESLGDKCTDLSIQNSRSCCLQYDCVDYLFIHEKQLDRITVQVKREKNPVNPQISHSWIKEICMRALSTEPPFIVELVSPLCDGDSPHQSQTLSVNNVLQTEANSDSFGNINSNDLYNVPQLDSGGIQPWASAGAPVPIHSQNNGQLAELVKPKVSTDAAVKQENIGKTPPFSCPCTDIKQQLLTNTKLNSANSEAKQLNKEPKNAKLGGRNKSRPMYVNDLPYSVLQSISYLLNVPQGGRDWRGVAEHFDMDLDIQKVEAYAAVANPAQAVLLDWSRSRLGTVDQLLTILKYPQIDRKDVVKILFDSLAL